MHANPSRYSLLAVVGAGFFVAAPIATWLVVDAMTAPSPLDAQPLALDVPLIDFVDSPEPLDVVAQREEVARVDLHLLAQDAHIVPAYQSGRVVGLKLFGIRDGSDFARAGLQNGDVLTRINGIELTSPSRAIEAYERANDGLVVVDFLRRGQRGTLTHHISSSPPAP